MEARHLVNFFVIAAVGGFFNRADCHENEPTGRVPAASAVAAVQKLELNELAGRWEMRDHFIDDTDGRKGGKGISIHISSDPAKDGSEREKVYFLEAGIRAGRLMGCQISGEDGSPVDGASCRFERGEFFVEVASKSGSKIVHKLSGRRDGLIVGDCFMVNRIIPTGQVKIADVTLRKLN